MLLTLGLPVALVLLIIVIPETGAAWTERLKVAVPVPPVLVALRVTCLLPAWVGVPLMMPSAMSMVRPEGRLVAS